jgi:hypothetical protein
MMTSAKNAAVAASVIVAALLFALTSASAFSLGSVLANHSGPEQLRLIHVKDLARLMADKGTHVYIFDADPPEVREQEGVIPRAALLSSYDGYDIAKDLPADKNAKLVFYCHNLH